jgi:recombination protein RecA
MYGTGISREGEVIEMGVAQNLIEKSGSWYSYKGERIGQGKENVREYLKQHPQTSKEIETALRAKLLVPKKGEAVAGEAAED